MKKLFKSIYSLFKAKPISKTSPRILNMWEHESWGNSIFFMSWEDRVVAGFLSEIPEKGDILRCKMETGKIARFEFTEVDRMSNPPDQFFATVKDLNYEI